MMLRALFVAFTMVISQYDGFAAECGNESPAFVYRHTEVFDYKAEEVFYPFYRPDPKELIHEWPDLKEVSYPSEKERYFVFASAKFAKFRFTATDEIVQPGIRLRYRMSGDADGIGDIEFQSVRDGTEVSISWVICRLTDPIQDAFFRTPLGNYLMARQNKARMKRGFNAMRRIIRKP